MLNLNYNVEILDNFLTNEHFNELSKIGFDMELKNEISVLHNKINKENEIEVSCIDKNLIQSLHKTYHEKMMNILIKLSPKKAKLLDYSDFSLIKCSKNYNFPFHDDTPNKLLSGVVYLLPEKNLGTIFSSNKDGSNSKMIEWKQNRAVFFSRIERETWHSFKGDGLSDRIALVYNLNTNNIKDVCRIEKKNYYFSFFRYKINPYMLDYFKFTI